MPNGDAGAGGFPGVDILQGPDVPGTPIPSGPVGGFISAAVDFFSGLFGGGDEVRATAFESVTQEQRNVALARAARGREPRTGFEAEIFASIPPALLQQQQEQFEVAAFPRPPIPTPEEGGPELVTERFRNLPPFPDAPEFVSGTFGLEGIDIMPVDVPLLSSFLPAIRQAAPTIQGLIGGFTGGLLQEVFRPTGELGLGQIPMRQPAAQVPGVCPPEKPHTRILRFIKMNTGVSIKLSRAKAMIRELGLENAARCLGINVSEVCSLLIVASPRRRRGISASDIRIVKRTARRFDSLKHALGHLGGRTGIHHHRRRTTRHAHK